MKRAWAHWSGAVRTVASARRIASTHALLCTVVDLMHSVLPRRNLRVWAGSYVAVTWPYML